MRKEGGERGKKKKVKRKTTGGKSARRKKTKAHGYVPEKKGNYDCKENGNPPAVRKEQTSRCPAPAKRLQ